MTSQANRPNLRASQNQGSGRAAPSLWDGSESHSCPRKKWLQEFAFCGRTLKEPSGRTGEMGKKFSLKFRHRSSNIFSRPRRIHQGGGNGDRSPPRKGRRENLVFRWPEGNDNKQHMRSNE